MLALLAGNSRSEWNAVDGLAMIERSGQQVHGRVITNVSCRQKGLQACGQQGLSENRPDDVALSRILQLHHLNAAHPRRPPDWRRQRVELMLQGGSSAWWDDDDWYVKAAVRHCRAVERQGTKKTTKGFKLAITLAEQIWHDGGPVKWEIEARLLAGRRPQMIASTIGVPLDVVRWYARLYFDVTGRLKCFGWITHEVLGLKLQCGMTVKDVDALWKAFGFWLGPVALDAIVAEFKRSGGADYSYIFDAGAPDKCSSPLDRAIRECLRLYVLPLTVASDVLHVLWLYLGVDEQKRQTEIKSRAQTDVVVKAVSVPLQETKVAGLTVVLDVAS